MSTVSQQLPLMPLREVVMFPNSIVPLFVGRDASITAINTALESFDRKVFLVAQKDPSEPHPDNDALFKVGTICKVLQVLRLPDDTVKVLFEGVERAEWSQISDANGVEDAAYQLATVTPLPSHETVTDETAAIMRACAESLASYGKINKKLTGDIIQTIISHKTAGEYADAIFPHLAVSFDKKQAALEELDTAKRLEQAFTFLETELAIADIERNIKMRVKDQMEKNQREYYLNEQIKAIHKEMGREDDPAVELEELTKALLEKDMPEEARERGMKEIKKLRQTPPSSAEYTVVRNYIDWIIDLPWNKEKETSIDLDKAEKVLDADHYGLEKPKQRILEYLAVQKLTKSLRGPILCLVGPPGVGKTSLARSIANATGRDYIRLSLGGVRDEAEIRGHRRTYVGALPGKIIQSLRRVKHNNPLFCLDEIDKMSTDFRGDPSSALLEVLDPEQNNTFGDHYLDLDYDLSKIFFITTANSLHSIPGPLQDRMEIIQLPGYLETEKKQIARRHLLPKQVEMHGLFPENIHVSDTVITDIIQGYTREAGVRDLERQLAALCRKTAVKLVNSKAKRKRFSITRQNLESNLGIPQFRHGEIEQKSYVGVSTGLAYTQVGGEMLMVETALMPGSGTVKTTGKLGEVMTESAQAALSYIRSRSDIFGLKSDFYKEIDIHIHVPEGATPKDGPSAGITLATSLVSALLGFPIHNDVAMTGEITLRGRVLPIGGLREKLLAANRGNIKTVIVPKDNEKDVRETPDAVKKGLRIVFVEHVDEVLPVAIQASLDDIFPGRKDFVPIVESLKRKDEMTDAHATQ